MVSKSTVGIFYEGVRARAVRVSWWAVAVWRYWVGNFFLELYGGFSVLVDDFQFVFKQIFNYVTIFNFVAAAFKRAAVGNRSVINFDCYGRCVVSCDVAGIYRDLINCNLIIDLRRFVSKSTVGIFREGVRVCAVGVSAWTVGIGCNLRGRFSGKLDCCLSVFVVNDFNFSFQQIGYVAVGDFVAAVIKRAAVGYRAASYVYAYGVCRVRDDIALINRHNIFYRFANRIFYRVIIGAVAVGREGVRVCAVIVSAWTVGVGGNLRGNFIFKLDGGFAVNFNNFKLIRKQFVNVGIRYFVTFTRKVAVFNCAVIDADCDGYRFIADNFARLNRDVVSDIAVCYRGQSINSVLQS